jgi:hypothetical protein
MKSTRKMHRIAIAALSASLVLPIAPVFGQDAPAAAPPPVVTISPPPPVITAPPPPTATAPPPRINIVPQQPVARAAPPPAATARPAIRTTRAAPVRTRAAAPVRQTTPAPAPVAAPVAAAPAPVAVPPADALPAPAPVEPAAQPVETAAPGGRSILPWLIGGALLLGALAFFFLRRRRDVDEEVYEETAYEEPVVAAAPDPDFARPDTIAPVQPAYVAPVAAAAAIAAEPVTADEVVVDDADQADVDALAADSAPVAGRPWLEFLLRPVRAGTSQDDTIVQFELTVGNTGTVAAKDVRISTWMFAAGEGTDMERMLIDPPADATVSEVDIAAGDGTRVDGEISLPKTGNAETVLPVVVADARYRLPDGREGRTSASFAIGLPEGDGIAPFQLDRASGLIESVEARLHGEPQRV